MSARRTLNAVIMICSLALAACGGGGGGGNAGGGDDTGTAPPDPPPPPPSPAGTFIAGTVLDTNAFTADGSVVPIAGVRVSFLGEGTVVETDGDGEFLIEDLVAGEKVIDFDTSAAMAGPNGASYAGFRERIVLVDGANQIDRPFYLPRVNGDSLTTVNPAVDTVVTNAEIGVSLTVFAGSARDQEGNLFSGQLSISEVPDGLAPAALPEDLEPGLLFTIQPVGVTFDIPATLSIRNDRDNWPAGSAIDFWSLDPDLGVFAIVGEGMVVGDASTIETLSGGVRAADWHAPLPPAVSEGDTPDDNDGDCQSDVCCDKCARYAGSHVEVSNGRFRAHISLPAHFSQSRHRQVELIYSSDRAFPNEVMVVAPIIDAATPVPNQISYQGIIDGIDQEYEIFLDASTLEPGIDQAFRIALPLDATALPTGSYVGQARVSSHYDATTVSGRILDDYMIVNDTQSEFGAGWRLRDHDRIYPAASGGVVLVDGSGFPNRFREANGSGSIVTVVATADDRPEVDTLQNLLDQIGAAHQFRHTGTTLNTVDTPLSMDDIADSSLILITETNGVGVFGFGGLDDDIKRNLLDILDAAHDQGVPLLFAGASLGPVTSQLVEADLLRYERLTGVRRNTAEEPRGGGFGSRGFWRLADPGHPIFNGPFGTVSPDPSAPFAGGLGSDTDFSPGIDQQANLGETILVEEYFDPQGNPNFQPEILNDQAIFTHRNAVSGASALTVMATIPGQNAAPLDPIVDSILKNAVVWLTSEIATEPGQLVSPAGDSSVLTVLEDGSYTRRTRAGDLHTFDQSGLLQTRADRNANTTTYAYDANDRVVSITDPVGRITTLSYENATLQAITDPVGRLTSFAYDGDGNLLQVMFPDGTTREFTYDERHLMTSQTDQRGFTNRYEFNAAGHFLQSTQSDGSVRTLEAAQSVGLIEVDSEQ
ncbi:MAG: hypothetical protein AAGA68_10675 [Pseudomonadota bacterium]